MTLEPAPPAPVAREVANRIIFIDEGVVKVDKPPKEFFANPENERLKTFLSKVL